MDNPESRKIPLTRRQMFDIIPGYIGMSRILEGRKSTGTKQMQIEMIKLLWKISQKAGCLMFFYAPIGRFFDDFESWNSGIPIQITGMTDEYAIMANSEEAGTDIFNFEYVEGNKIVFNKLPEVINYNGDFCLIAETFRLQLKKYQYTWQDF